MTQTILNRRTGYQSPPPRSLRQKRRTRLPHSAKWPRSRGYLRTRRKKGAPRRRKWHHRPAINQTRSHTTGHQHADNGRLRSRKSHPSIRARKWGPSSHYRRRHGPGRHGGAGPGVCERYGYVFDEAGEDERGDCDSCEAPGVKDIVEYCGLHLYIGLAYVWLINVIDHAVLAFAKNKIMAAAEVLKGGLVLKTTSTLPIGLRENSWFKLTIATLIDFETTSTILARRLLRR